MKCHIASKDVSETLIMVYQTLAHIPSSVLLETFNVAFSDYINPTPPLSMKVFDWKIQRDGMGKKLSTGMFTGEGELVGFMLHAPGEWKGKNAVYNGGTGIIPDFRGKGGGKGMYEFILPLLTENGIEGSILECIMGNDRAFNLYKGIGFEVERELICYAGMVSRSYMPPEGVYWKELKSLEELDVAHFWDSLHSWQNSIYAVQRVAWSYRMFGLYKEHQLVGYGIINPLNGYIPQFGIHADHRREGLGKFLFSLLQHTTQRQLALINIDPQSASIPSFVADIGMQETLRQHEMWLPLA